MDVCTGSIRVYVIPTMQHGHHCAKSNLITVPWSTPILFDHPPPFPHHQSPHPSWPVHQPIQIDTFPCVIFSYAILILSIYSHWPIYHPSVSLLIPAWIADFILGPLIVHHMMFGATAQQMEDSPLKAHGQSVSVYTIQWHKATWVLTKVPQEIPPDLHTTLAVLKTK